ncbi:hypothetical protein EUX98_g166 [Antrodiella citrinella]|uniref:Uncharacterized protein n=1 Tax=Antrodiella citrinella TaxID=2447956 RepID=A0A4V3XJR8_9APHY|nr:hypothetical protein EUX98_g166 [Antrodiella citrinella]
MSTSAAPTVTRGEITLQPSYFTSSLYVLPLRHDISCLIHTFEEQYMQSDKSSPFALFKQIWSAFGWVWLHFKVFDGRSRERFIGVTLRLFAERMLENENAIARVVALFGMYTFFMTQPSTSLPPVHSLKHIAVPIDVFKSITAIPDALTETHHVPLRPYATHVLSQLLDGHAFHILPESSLRSQNPASLPREFFVRDDADPSAVSGEASDVAGPSVKPPTKKKGRPSKRDKAKKTKEAIGGLDKWLEKNTFTYAVPPTYESEEVPTAKTTHTLIAHPPVMTHSNYAVQKAELLDKLESSGPPESGRGPMARANEAVLTRLKRIDEMAAEKGLEVGGEGGDMTGLSRVAKAVEDLREGNSKGGILNLLEGAGFRIDGDTETG